MVDLCIPHGPKVAVKRLRALHSLSVVNLKRTLFPYFGSDCWFLFELLWWWFEGSEKDKKKNNPARGMLVSVSLPIPEDQKSNNSLPALAS